MIKTIFFTAAFSASILSAGAQKSSKASTSKSVRFLDNIEVSLGAIAAAKPIKKETDSTVVIERKAITSAPEMGTIESVTSLQLKYSLLLDQEVEKIQNLPLFSIIEDWWGTKYQLGGNDKTGIDCSGFTHVLYDTLYKINLPRISRDQFQFLSNVSPTEMKEGDLVFFGAGIAVSHVGFYLRNNKFVHASTSEGVTISDLNDAYWSKRFVGVGRYDANAASIGLLKP